MAILKKYNLDGNEIGEVEIDDSLLDRSVNKQLIKDYLVAVKKNARQWSASTKGRSEIAHSNKKPHPQKGTGRARQGTIKAPQYRGGATVFGPKPKFNMHVKVNKKEKRSAIYFLLAQKIVNGNIYILQLDSIEVPKTKRVAMLLQAMGIRGKNILFLGNDLKEKNHMNFVKSSRNIPRASFLPVRSVNGFDVIRSQEIVVIEPAFDHVKEMLEKGKRI